MTARELKNKIDAYLRDKASENRLGGYNEEYSLEEVINAANLTLEEINYKGIIKTSFTMETCDPYLLRLGTAKTLISGTIVAKTRNYVTVNDGGVSVNREGNIDLYTRLYQIINDEFQEQLDAKKCHINLMRGWNN
ncbi:MAG: hypothetical protein Q8M92_08485 [Candidatus Subteraquimicrobiales bacterium]|nr:hypothetical protein [Candidatus Subteraquimicrobiales bacterium]